MPPLFGLAFRRLLQLLTAMERTHVSTLQTILSPLWNPAHPLLLTLGTWTKRTNHQPLDDEAAVCLLTGWSFVLVQRSRNWRHVV
jgi:hypothetical protein